ncbi:adenylate/guanylate cyclase domain-containing protein [Bradyrhizobium canariense]|uniref:Adenylate cyclase n=1 Tax=Bradyrhizobium canariense TaxID=255045 RepID=A0A1H1ZF76_9BRAD|nr:adenylate/guanylate cyclase domain-containing protein [Bradyrhizobium canariense]SDT32374.1 adenylate cyclase [Bradyrhizobium canariense]
MNARLERKLRTLAAITVVGTSAGLVVAFAQGHTSVSAMIDGAIYGLLMGITIGGLELFVLDGPLRDWLGGLSFTANLIVRSAIYAAIIMLLQFSQVGELAAGLPMASRSDIRSGFVLSAGVSVLVNLGFGIANLVGARALLNFITGRYHAPVTENRFVLFVDIAGSTGLAERLGGIAIHRLLDRTFRLLTLAVVDYRGEVLNYVGDEVIVTWPERDGAVDCRPLRCFFAMRGELANAANHLQREFGTVPHIRGSLHFGPVIVGEIGDVKRAIVFNGDVMNIAARLEALSRTVDGGFLASRAAMERFNSAPPFAVRDLGRLPIRGRVDGIDVVGIESPNSAERQGQINDQGEDLINGRLIDGQVIDTGLTMRKAIDQDAG